MDSEWALDQIKIFMTLTDQVGYDNSGGGIVVLGSHMRGSEQEAEAAAHVVEQILDRVLPRWKNSINHPDRNYRQLRKQASRARVVIERESELTEKLGDFAPQISLNSLHSWVWEAARLLWQSGNFSLGVLQASIAVSVHAQAKLGRRDVSEAALFKQAFTTDAPTASSPRLRLGIDDGSDTFRSRQRGAMAVAEGLYAAVRNPLGHELAPDWEEYKALEMLAAFSMLARWVDESEVIRGESRVSPS